MPRRRSDAGGITVLVLRLLREALALALLLGCLALMAQAPTRGADIPARPPVPAPGYGEAAGSLFHQAHKIEVYVRYLDTRQKPGKVKEIERVLHDRQTFGKIKDILMAHAAGAQAVERGPGFSASSVHLRFDFKDAKNKSVGTLVLEDGDLLLFDPGDDFEVDRKLCRELVRLFVLHGEQLK